MIKKVKKSSGNINSEAEKKPLLMTGNKEERRKIISREISGIKTAGKEINKKHMPDRPAISAEKTHIKKSVPSQEERHKKIMPERTGAPLEKAHIKKSVPSKEIITGDNLSKSEYTQKDGPGIKKKKIIKKIIKSPAGEIIKKVIREQGQEQKSIEENRVLKKIKDKSEEKKEPSIEKKITIDDDLIDSLLLIEGITTKELTGSKETSVLKEKKFTPDDDIIDSLLLAEGITERIEDKGEKRTVPLSDAKEDLRSAEAGKFIHTCLEKVIELGASDLHLSTGQKPIVRCRGELQNLSMPPLKKEHTEGLLKTILSREEKDRLFKQQSIDFMYIMPSKGGPPHRFRSNVYYHRAGLNAVMRIIPNKIPTIKELGMPDILSAFGRFNQGLVLVTGSTGSGKTTTLAALIDLINTERNDHIVTIEDPIEFIHKPERCIVRQRQVGVHTKNYNRALKASIREDPDVILVSELRDLETIQLAMTAAETGCLVLSTMSTTSAARTIDRIIDFFPADQRLQAGAMLSDSLRAIVSQQLIPSTDRKMRFAAVEILIGCTPLSSLIKEQKTFQISSLIETSRGLGMQSMDSSLMTLLEDRMITYDVAHEAAMDKTIFEQYKNNQNQGQLKQSQ
ncbi:MAG: PilT/PilU family type 4a pilus ATPase [Candidatus Eremiobacterota bacterium]